jgi:hypothetical protein
VGPVNIDEWYFDVSNIAYYDAIVGMPFCQKHQVKIDIGSRTIEVAGQLIEIAGGRRIASDELRNKKRAAGAPQSFRA